jgi:oxygen-independent coproporphyrinogen-3 oxidase
MLRAIDGELGLAPGAEVTIEANPESVDQRVLDELLAEGVTRISFGMQSAMPHVLGVLDRVHQPGRPAHCAAWARAAGFEHISLDLIYGTPGESDQDWLASLEAALAAEPDHVSAYALIVEPGTRLAARVRRGELPAPDDDAMADRYLMADQVLAAAGFRWYEVSNWAHPGLGYPQGTQSDGAGWAGGARCAHNLLYWTGGDWWGIGPGAHSHVGGTRWWNVRHPAAYASRLSAGISPGQARETLTAAERRMERIMLLTRLSEGCPVAELGSDANPAAQLAATSAAESLVADGLADSAALAGGRIVLTRRGRLLADAVIRTLTD